LLKRLLKGAERTLSHGVIALIRGYSLFVSPVFPRSCRFHPTCSRYAVEAIERHGLLKGLFLATKRVLRCNPLSKGGYDPVP